MKDRAMTIQSIREGLQAKEFSITDIVTESLRRMQENDSVLHTYVTMCEGEALAAAQEADALLAEKPNIWDEKPFFGIPYSLKDIVVTEGIETTASSNVLRGYIPRYSATVYKRLQEAGAILLGKTNTDSFAHGSSTETSDFFTTSNPVNHDYLPGGSSGGSAATVGAQEVPFSIGSETAGSIRLPAAWCGVVGLKPTYGRVSRYGFIAMASSLDSPGPLTNTVADAAEVLGIIAGKDSHDATSSPLPVGDYGDLGNATVSGLRVAVPYEYFDGVQDEVVASMKSTLALLESQGAHIEWVHSFDPKYAVSVYTIQQRSEVSSNLARYTGLRYGNSREAFNHENRNRIMFGTYALSAKHYDALYKKAARVRTKIIQDFDRLFSTYDVVIGPTAASTAPKKGASEGVDMFGEMTDRLLEPSTIAGLPGISIPCGVDAKGLPIGLQIIGKQFDEKKILRVAEAVEKILP